MRESLKEDGRPAQQWYWDDWFSEFGLRLCGLAARGLWIDMLGIMFKAEIRGTLRVNGKQIDSKSLAKLVGDKEENINKYLKELEENDVFSRLEDGTIISRRMYRESRKKEEISRIRSEAGKKGMVARWGKEDNKEITEAITKDDNKKISKITASTSTPTSTPNISETTNVVSVQNDEDRSEQPPSDHSSKKKEKPKINFNFETKEWENISQEDIKVWKEAYPACDIDFELKQMKAWLLANPKKRKKDYKRFINNWLSREQDRGGSRNGYQKSLDEFNEMQRRALRGVQ